MYINKHQWSKEQIKIFSNFYTKNRKEHTHIFCWKANWNQFFAVLRTSKTKGVATFLKKKMTSKLKIIYQLEQKDGFLKTKRQRQVSRIFSCRPAAQLFPPLWFMPVSEGSKPCSTLVWQNHK